MNKLRPAVNRIRRYLGSREVQAWLPNRKVLAGAVGAGLALVLREVGILDELPAGYLEIAAYAIVAYLVPQYDDPELEVVFEGEPFAEDELLPVEPPPFHTRPFDFFPDEPVEGEEDTLRHRDEGPGLV